MYQVQQRGRWNFVNFPYMHTHYSFHQRAHIHPLSFTSFNNKLSRSKKTSSKTTSLGYLIAGWHFLDLPNHLNPGTTHQYLIYTMKCHSIFIYLSLNLAHLIQLFFTELWFPWRRNSKWFPVGRMQTKLGKSSATWNILPSLYLWAKEEIGLEVYTTGDCDLIQSTRCLCLLYKI